MVSTPDAHHPATSRGLVVLCCADENLLELAPVVEGLNDLSLRVELVSGVDLDSTLVNSAAQRLGQDPWWVLCQSEALDTFQVGRLESNLAECGVGSSKVITAEVDSTTPSQLVERISAAIPNHAHALNVRSNSPTDASNATGRLPGQTGPSPTIGALLSNDLPPAMPEDDFDTPARNMTPIYIAGGVAGAVVVGLISFFALRPSGGPEQAAPKEEAVVAQADQAQAEDKLSAEAAVEAAKASADTDGAETDATAEGETGEAAAADDGEVVEETLEAGDADGEVPEEAVEDADTDADEAPGEELPSTTSAEEQALIDVALRKGEIRSVDILLVKPKRSRRYNYEKSREWCEETEIDGIGGWRLPTVGEIRVITDTRIMPKDYYWTHMPADTYGTQRLVYAKSKRIMPKKDRWTGGRAVCVRTRDGAPAIAAGEEQDEAK